jgi:hypothetical protein
LSMLRAYSKELIPFAFEIMSVSNVFVHVCVFVNLRSIIFEDRNLRYSADHGYWRFID